MVLKGPWRRDTGEGGEVWGIIVRPWREEAIKRPIGVEL